jgi:acetyl esterase
MDMFSNIETNQRNISINADVGVILYYPKGADVLASNQTRPVMIWIHGGGFISGSAHGDRIITQNFADGCDCIVASIDYRLAPENPFPAAPQDTMLALQWIYDNIASYAGDPTKLVIGGESAGGNLAAATVLGIVKSSQEGLLAAVRGLVLAAPCLDHGSYTGSHFKYATTGLLSLTQMLWYWRLYLGDNDQGGICASNSLACPLRLSPDEAAKFPPTKIVLAQQDILFDEGMLFGDKLKASSVNVDTVVYPGAIHGHFGKPFFGNSGTSSLRDAMEFFKDVTKS